MNAPSERAQWNVRVIVNLLVLAAYFTLLGVGVAKDALTVTEALSLIGSTALGGGVGWMIK